MRTILISIILCLMVVPAQAKRLHYCDGHRPYYHEIDVGPGSLIADLFFFVGTTPVGVAATAVTLDAHALCVPVSHATRLVIAKRKVQNRKDGDNANTSGY